MQLYVMYFHLKMASSQQSISYHTKNPKMYDFFFLTKLF